LFTDVVDTGEKFITDVIVTRNHCSPESLILAINLSPVLLSPGILFTCVNDTGDKIIGGINDTIDQR
jgi:hypothetical protein